MRTKIIELCTQKGWKLTDQDAGETPNFYEIKKFLADKAIAAERVAVYARDNALPRGSDGDAISPSSTAVNSPRPDPIKELTEQMAALTLLVKSNLSGSNLMLSTPALAPVTSPNPRSDRTPRCIWCDSRDHSRRSDCTLFADTMKTGNIKINENGRVAFSTGGEIPTAFGRGGMKSIYDVVYPAPAQSQATVRAITFDDGNYEDGAWVTTITKDELVDVTVDEKRARDEGRLPRNVKRRVNDPRPGTPLPGPAPSATPTATPTASGASPAPAIPTMDLDPPDPAKPKYRLQSELGKSIGVAEVGEKIMNAPITLAIKEFLAVSPEMANYLHEQTRRKRVPVDTDSAIASTVEYDVNVQATTVAASKPIRPCSCCSR